MGTEPTQAPYLGWFLETLDAARNEDLIRRNVRPCTCELNRKDDPDCELHHPDASEDVDYRRQSLVMWLRGYEAAQLGV